MNELTEVLKLVVYAGIGYFIVIPIVGLIIFAIIVTWLARND